MRVFPQHRLSRISEMICSADFSGINSPAGNGEDIDSFFNDLSKRSIISILHGTLQLLNTAEYVSIMFCSVYCIVFIIIYKNLTRQMYEKFLEYKKKFALRQSKIKNHQSKIVQFFTN